MNRILKPTLFTMLIGSTIAAAPGVASAYNLVDKDESALNLDIELALGHFSSGETYGNSDTSPSWTEGYAKYGLSGSHSIGSGTLFGAVNALSSGTCGDGDALGVTNGDNDATELDLWVEWAAMDHLIISPLMGFYTPDSSASNQGNDDTNIYAQVIAVVPF
jgi:hypothetical protein